MKSSEPKQLVEEFRALDCNLFPYQKVRTIPDDGMPMRLDGLEAKAFRHCLMIYSPARGWDGRRNAIRIPFSHSKGHYGNSRYWFLCPRDSTRCKKLYLYWTSEGEPLFLCRKCLGLSYSCQNTTSLGRLLHKKQSILRKLGIEEEAYSFTKPLGMHWKTFNRLKEELSQLTFETNQQIYEKYGHLA